MGAVIAGETADDFAVPLAEPGLVLLVEDDFVLRTALAELLQSDGYGVECAADGLEALTRLRNGPKPSLIVLDIMLPHMDGREFRSLQQSARRMADIPVVVITAASISREDQALLSPDRLFFKPFATSAFLASVQQLCAPILS